MTRARTLADLGSASLATDAEVTAAIDAIPPAKGKNLLYNGAMQVTQRGTSVAGITTSSYNTADRWVTDFSSLGTWTNTVESDAPTGSGLRKSFKVLCTTANSSPSAAAIIQVQQRLEGADLQRIAKGTASAQQMTLSFWVKANVTGTYVVYLYDADNNRIVSATYSVVSSATWERKTITFPSDTAGAFDNDNSGSLFVSFVLGAGSNHNAGSLQTTWGSVGTNYATGQTNLAAATSNYWQVTGVQLEVGDTATEFEFKSFGQELLECQRYYQKSYNYEDVPGSASTGQIVIAGMANASTNTGNNNVGFRFASRMRTTPTVTAYNYLGTINSLHYAKHNTAATAAPAGVVRTSDTGSCIYTTGASGLTVGYAVEIIFHYTASAEL